MPTDEAPVASGTLKADHEGEPSPIGYLAARIRRRIRRTLVRQPPSGGVTSLELVNQIQPKQELILVEVVAKRQIRRGAWNCWCPKSFRTGIPVIPHFRPEC